MPDPALVWGLFPRLLALVYVVAFVSLRLEILAWAGSRGISPVAEKLARARADYGRWRAVMRHPSLLWVTHSDAALRALPLIGMTAALLAIVGIASPAMLAAAWVVYLSLDVAMGLTYPWESLLLEAGFLAIFLPAIAPLPALTAAALPAPLLLLAFHWLLFRVLFGFGKTKFTREALHDPTYLQGFLISQPIPSPLGWLAMRLPRPVLTAAHGALFVVEVLLPFLVFVPGRPRLAAAAGFTGLMVSIQAFGNFGFFNVLVIVLCVPLLDRRAATQALIAPVDPLTAAVAAWSFAAGLLHLPFNTWVARSWTEWPVWGALAGLPSRIVAVLRGAMPFRTVHAYGVFPPRIGPPLKFLPVLEGTRDGVTWETFEYRFMPSTERSRPRFVAPHCPRLDHAVLYEGFALGSSNYLSTIFSQGNPYEFTTVSPMERVMERLMDGDSPVRGLFRELPFRGQPPLRMRMRMYAFAPTSVAERHATGRWWDRRLIGEHLPERGSDPARTACWLPAAEQLHPDERWARRRIPRLRPLLDARTLDAVHDVLDAGALALSDRFWRDVIPSARGAADSGWPSIDAGARRLASSRTAADMNGLDRIRGAVTTALLERMDPFVLRQAAPALVVPSYFHASVVAHAVVLAGRHAVEQALRDEDVLRGWADTQCYERGLMLLAFFRRDMLAMHARKHRLIAAVLPPPAPHNPAVPGFALLLPLLACALPDPSERIPVVTQLPSGTWTCDGSPVLTGRGGADAVVNM